jgi:TonB family protein
MAVTGARAQGCYERALRQNSTLQGRLMIRVRVGPRGEVCAASVASDSLGDQGVSSCVLQKFQATTFPAPVNGCVDIQVPLRFEPKLK